MMTHKYQFPAQGNIHDNCLDNYRQVLEEKLRNSSECLMSYCIFPTDSDILDKVTFNRDKDGNLSAINLHTYTKLWDGMEEDFKICVETNVFGALTDCDFDPEHPVSIGLKNEVNYLGIYGEIPKTLYHIAEGKDMNDIMRKGLIPDIGSNNYKNIEPKIYLCDEKDLAPWLAILKHKDDPIILQVSTLDSEGYPVRYFKSGRVFSDRDYIQGSYGEYCTEHQIPPEVLKKVDLSRGNELSTMLCGKMIEMLEHTTKESDIAEVQTGLNRLTGMDLMKQEQVEAMVETHKQLLMQEGPENISRCYEEDDNEELPWDENDAGRDLTRALSEMSQTDIKL